ncbi:hypothetical protein MF271_17425 (plasmid) [Deinococcus sp. KNUC1210]|uniref:AfsR/SARP family transcriptional regulator n=1 Tax=Deinococcus sp. KNUC1210 TaxID=2917691 RepID=UPI001EEF86FB|nr:BTAD domain-containing putative transcriptional regulator [Deinococcus sp. KNUC1210]ULH16962.1 hypothetical protein MF271_17425 [Deinococcus sp. KNUC1210]
MEDAEVELKLSVLGVPLLVLGGHTLSVSGKSLALVCYLALEGTTRRGVLADLFWSDRSEEDARRNLRRELHRLRATPLGTSLKAHDDLLSLTADLDLSAFRELSAQGDAARAAALLRGPFLDGLDPPAAHGFSEWRERWATELQEEQIWALLTHAAAIGYQEPRRAAELYHRCLRLDPLREQVHRELIGLHLRLGNTGRPRRSIWPSNAS